MAARRSQALTDIIFLPVLCGQFSKDPDAPWRLRQSRAPSIFPQGQRKVLVLPPTFCWCCPPTFGPLPPRLLPLPPFSISALNGSHNAFTPLPFGKHCSRPPPTSDCCSLKPEASEPFDSLHLFAKLRKPPLAASDVHLSLPD